MGIKVPKDVFKKPMRFILIFDPSPTEGGDASFREACAAGTPIVPWLWKGEGTPRPPLVSSQGLQKGILPKGPGDFQIVGPSSCRAPAFPGSNPFLVRIPKKNLQEEAPQTDSEEGISKIPKEIPAKQSESQSAPGRDPWWGSRGVAQTEKGPTNTYK